MSKITTFLFVILTLTCCCFAQEDFVAIPGQIELNKNDTFVFLGDSITHQCYYTQYVEDYYYTRYPNTRINFINSGVSGDSASDALARFDEEVTMHKPKYVSILLGMNDGRYRHFDHEVFATYEKGMTKILDKIKELGAQAIPMTPTMFDSRYDTKTDEQKHNWMQPKKDRTDYYNSVLAFYGAWLREQAFYRGLHFVDMYGPLNHITLQQRKIRPDFSVITDAVHPNPNGQIVMALAMLSDIGVDDTVFEIAIDVKDFKWSGRAKGGKVTDIDTKVPGFLYSFSSEDIPETASIASFTFTANALPWVVPEQARLGHEISNAASKLSREILTVTGIPNLNCGKFQLLIDGNNVGTYTVQELAHGIELQSNPNSPQYKQALAVAEINKERNDNAIRKLRDLWSRKKEARRDKLETNNPEMYKQFVEKQKEDTIALRKLAKDYEDKIYEANKPKPHRYRIVKIN